MKKVFIGIDNGVTGSMGVITENSYNFLKIPVIKELSYTKVKQYITRLNFLEFDKILKDYIFIDNTIILIERPMVNPTRYKATLSAIRCLEATLIAIELNKISYMYINSSQWQKELLPLTRINIHIRYFI